MYTRTWLYDTEQDKLLASASLDRTAMVAALLSLEVDASISKPSFSIGGRHLDTDRGQLSMQPSSSCALPKAQPLQYW